MKELVEVIAKALAEHPDEVVVTEKKEGRTVRVQLGVAPSDMGKVIGKQGRIAKSIRALAQAGASLKDIRGEVDIDSNDELQGISSEPESAE